jgi:hypothetical protein
MGSGQANFVRGCAIKYRQMSALLPPENGQAPILPNTPATFVYPPGKNRCSKDTKGCCVKKHGSMAKLGYLAYFFQVPTRERFFASTSSIVTNFHPCFSSSGRV